ncbi:hypothetical protein NXX53_11655 [Bacteroides salyersiae]|nr:hypothetical protein [Bacteroides salyersiae]
MSNKDLNRSIKIFIDGSEAAQGVSKVENAIQKLEAKLAGLNKSESLITPLVPGSYSRNSIKRIRLFKTTKPKSKKPTVF